MPLEKTARAGNTQIEVFVKINVPIMLFVFGVLFRQRPCKRQIPRPRCSITYLKTVLNFRIQFPVEACQDPNPDG